MVNVHFLFLPAIKLSPSNFSKSREMRKCHQFVDNLQPLRTNVWYCSTAQPIRQQVKLIEGQWTELCTPVSSVIYIVQLLSHAISWGYQSSQKLSLFVENIILPCIFKLQSKSAHKFAQRYGYDIIYGTHDTSLEMCQNYTGLSSIADDCLWKNVLKPMQILCFLHCNKFIYLDT